MKLLAVILGLSSWSLASAGQSLSQEGLVAAAVLQYQIERGPLRSLAFDPRVAAAPEDKQSRWAHERDPGEMASIRTLTGASAGRLETFRRCVSQGQRDCGLDGVDAYVALTNPRIIGNTATVYMYFLRYFPNEKPAIYGQRAVVTVVREGVSWKVAAVKILAET